MQALSMIWIASGQSRSSIHAVTYASDAATRGHGLHILLVVKLQIKGELYEPLRIYDRVIATHK